MRSSIFAIALLTAIGLLATVQLGNLSNEVAAQEFVKKKKNPKYPYAKKKQFNYRLCRELGSSATSCGGKLRRWGTKHPNGKVIY
jgi:hypothetical protein